MLQIKIVKQLSEVSISNTACHDKKDYECSKKYSYKPHTHLGSYSTEKDIQKNDKIADDAKKNNECVNEAG